MITIGALNLGNGPRIAVPFRDGTRQEDIRRARELGMHLAELRIDLYSATDTSHVLGEVEKFAGVPTLATIRSSQEGGKWDKSDAERLALFEAVIPHVDAVDIEISSQEIRDDVIAAARNAGKTIIASFHDFKGTPPLHVIQAMADEGWKNRATAVKVATRCEDWNDLRTLAEFTLHNVSLGVVSIGMGPTGTVSRILFPALGSLFTFASFGEGTAPGQLTLEETAGYLRGLYPVTS